MYKYGKRKEIPGFLKRKPQMNTPDGGRSRFYRPVGNIIMQRINIIDYDCIISVYL
jgi:hypothetical protein